MLRRRRVFTGTRRSRRRWQWIRSNENRTNNIGAPDFNQIDLLSTYRALAGIDLNLPEFTIWRVRFRISIRITFPVGTTVVGPEDGAKLAVFVDDMADAGSNPVTAPYDEKYMLWDTLYCYESIMQGRSDAAVPPDGLAVFKDYDIKTHRKIGNLKESLMFQIAPTGSAIVTGFAWTQNTLVLLGH